MDIGGEDLVRKYIKYFIIVAAVGFCALGIWQGDMADVVKKAAAICLECCGIG